MNIFLYLTLGHFIADYPLQPGWLVRYKKKSIVGLLIHTFAHLVVTLVLVFPYLHIKEVWWAAIAIFFTHNIVDFTKIRLERFCPKCRFLWYVLDQIVHVVVITFIYFYWLTDVIPRISEKWAIYYNDLSIVNFVLILTLVTFFYDVTKWSYLDSRKKRPYVRNWRGMGRNALIVVIAFVLYWVTQ